MIFLCSLRYRSKFCRNRNFIMINENRKTMKALVVFLFFYVKIEIELCKNGR